MTALSDEAVLMQPDAPQVRDGHTPLQAAVLLSRRLSTLAGPYVHVHTRTL